MPLLAYDLLLENAARRLTDIEDLRKAMENRHRSMTHVWERDGVTYGLGLPADNPEVKFDAELVEGIKALEHQATLELQRSMRRHPLYPWVQRNKGVGEKQAARLLGTIGDPYWNDKNGRPRRVSELWSYCGLRTAPLVPDGPNVAVRRRKGERANWSTEAKMRVYLVAESCMKAGGYYRSVYDKRKANTENRTHAYSCPQCGPKGRPAPPGSPWSAGHRHADALRIVSKEILRDLWLEARTVHLEASASSEPAVDFSLTHH